MICSELKGYQFLNKGWVKFRVPRIKYPYATFDTRRIKGNAVVVSIGGTYDRRDSGDYLYRLTFSNRRGINTQQAYDVRIIGPGNRLSDEVQSDCGQGDAKDKEREDKGAEDAPESKRRSYHTYPEALRFT